jgi:uncharacterized protein DUF3179
VWTRTINGKVLHFYLAGINNQNFLMRDTETGSWWQQITGRAIYGPLKGSSLELVPSDELTFGQWKSEVTDGQVLAAVPKYLKEYDSNWEPEVAKLPVVISFPGTELKSRDVVVGLSVDGASRAYPWETLVKQSPVVDRVHGTPLLLVVGPDHKSFRVFVSRIDGKDTEFFLKDESDNHVVTAASAVLPAAAGSKSDSSAASPSATTPAAAAKAWTLLDTTTASEWNFQGCAISGPAQGNCLDRVSSLKDYWFDWRNYHPETSVYKH